MSGTIFTAVILLTGLLVLGTGLYYRSKEKDDPQSRSVYSIAAGLGAPAALGAIIKIVLVGF